MQIETAVGDNLEPGQAAVSGYRDPEHRGYDRDHHRTATMTAAWPGN